MKKPKSAERFDEFLKTFEWNWTKAVLAAIAITFITLITTSIIPSFWVYFAEGSSPGLGWAGGGASLEDTIHEVAAGSLWGPEVQKQIRDIIAMTLTVIPFILIFVVATVLQNKRRKLRGLSDSRPVGGYK